MSQKFPVAERLPSTNTDQSGDDPSVPSRRYDLMAGGRERRSKRSRIRENNRRYRSLFFIGKSLFIRGVSGQVHKLYALRSKHCAKIIRHFYAL